MSKNNSMDIVVFIVTAIIWGVIGFGVGRSSVPKPEPRPQTPFLKSISSDSLDRLILEVGKDTNNVKVIANSHFVYRDGYGLAPGPNSVVTHCVFNQITTDTLCVDAASAPFSTKTIKNTLRILADNSKSDIDRDLLYQALMEIHYAH